MLKIRQACFSVLNLDLNEESMEIIEATAHFYPVVTSTHRLMKHFSAQDLGAFLCKKMKQALQPLAQTRFICNTCNNKNRSYYV